MNISKTMNKCVINIGKYISKRYNSAIENKKYEQGMIIKKFEYKC